MKFRISVSDFSLLNTYSSGQVLNFVGVLSERKGAQRLCFATEKAYYEVAYRHASRSASGALSCVAYAQAGKSEATRELVGMLGLHNPIKKVYSEFAKDPVLSAAVKSAYGMRLTKADPWQAGVCFIISQFNNIKRIRLIVQRLMREFGERQGAHFLFPSSEALSRAGKYGLDHCGLGFRSKYLLEFASQYCAGALKGIEHMKYEKAKERLMEISGIGDKVADCILLFGYGDTRAFPIDTWVKRAMEALYFNNRKASIRSMHAFAESRFGALAGYAQQYLFQYARQKRLTSKNQRKTKAF
ncbi:MAG: hypothetical protein QXT43_00300 [Candidatus Micrarchaeaceae archaeon]